MKLLPWLWHGRSKRTIQLIMLIMWGFITISAFKVSCNRAILYIFHMLWSVYTYLGGWGGTSILSWRFEAVRFLCIGARGTPYNTKGDIEMFSLKKNLLNMLNIREESDRIHTWCRISKHFPLFGCVRGTPVVAQLVDVPIKYRLRQVRKHLLCTLWSTTQKDKH